MTDCLQRRGEEGVDTRSWGLDMTTAEVEATLLCRSTEWVR